MVLPAPRSPRSHGWHGPLHGAIAVAVAVLLAACGATVGDPGDDTGTPGGTATDDASLQGEVVVSAAASLTDAFEAIESAFESVHPDVDVVLNLAGSSTLREQVLAGAPVDVFASANTSIMDQLVEAAVTATPPRVFAANRLQVVVPAGNPAGVTGLGDFADEGLLIGLCSPGVPCGDFARDLLHAAGVVAAIDTNEPDVRALLTKVQAGELDAGITYVTDVASAAGDVEGIDIPADVNVRADYPITTVAGAPNPTVADAFVAFVLDESGQDILADFGFTTP